MAWALVKHNIVIYLWDDKPELHPDMELVEVGPAVKRRWKRVGNNFVPPQPGERPFAMENFFPNPILDQRAASQAPPVLTAAKSQEGTDGGSSN